MAPALMLQPWVSTALHVSWPERLAEVPLMAPPEMLPEPALMLLF
jgi:hypothetical protein